MFTYVTWFQFTSTTRLLNQIPHDLKVPFLNVFILFEQFSLTNNVIQNNPNIRELKNSNIFNILNFLTIDVWLLLWNMFFKWFQVVWNKSIICIALYLHFILLPVKPSTLLKNLLWRRRNPYFVKATLIKSWAPVCNHISNSII